MQLCMEIVTQTTFSVGQRGPILESEDCGKNIQ